MSESNLFAFLRELDENPALLSVLGIQGKDEVLTAAEGLGLGFTEQEFDAGIWSLEERLADRRGEPFSEKFTLWHLMWGQSYLEYLVKDLLPALQETGLVT